jgi:hypothetical protein
VFGELGEGDGFVEVSGFGFEVETVSHWDWTFVWSCKLGRRAKMDSWMWRLNGLDSDVRNPHRFAFWFRRLPLDSFEGLACLGRANRGACQEGDGDVG